MQNTNSGLFNQRLSKITRYLKRGDLSGLAAEIRQFMAWKKYIANISASDPSNKDEAAYWDQFNADLCRQVDWGSAGGGDLGAWAFQKMCDGQYPGLI